MAIINFNKKKWQLILLSVLFSIGFSISAQDSDLDGVINSIDIDDDNDGISDIDEGCYNTFFPGDSAPSYTGLPGNVLISYPFTASGSMLNPLRSNVISIITPASVSSMTIGSGFTATYRVGGSINLTSLNATSLDNAKALNEYLEFSFTTNSAPFSAYLDWFGFRNDIINSTNNVQFTTTFEISTDGFTNTANTTNLGTKASGAGQTGNLGRRAFDNADYPLIQSTTYTVRIYLYGLTRGTSINFDDPIIAFDFCNRDTDGDGVFDFLDLDSDNDGCLDAAEGATNFSEADLIALPSGTGLSLGSGSSATEALNLGTSVDANGMPSIAGSGQAVGYATTATAIVVSTQPLSQTVDDGGALTFSVVANAIEANSYDSGHTPDYSNGTLSSAPSSYQWQVSPDEGVTWTDVVGANISGETTDTLIITNIDKSMDKYQYRVSMTCVENNCPALSDSATLYFNKYSLIKMDADPIPNNSLLGLLITTLLVAIGAMSYHLHRRSV